MSAPIDHPERHAVGVAYERYVVIERIQAEGHAIRGHDTAREQLAHGDAWLVGKGGIEIKFDQRYHVTNNLYIETEQKMRPTDPAWLASSLFAEARYRWFGIGDYGDFYVFRRADLIAFAKSATCRIVENAVATGRGFLIPMGQRIRLRVAQRHWDDRTWDGIPVVRGMVRADEIRWSL